MKKIFKKYGTDKNIHNYIPFYADSFEKYRSSVKSFLEIGVWQGESLKAWRDYFPNAHVVGVEIDPKVVKIKNEPRISVEVGDATRGKFVNKLVKGYGKFDIVLDDGSHESVDMRRTFQLLWPHTNLVYCIEDLHTQYPLNCWSKGQKAGKQFGNRFIPDNASYMKDLKGLVDGINKCPQLRNDIFKICFYKWQVYIWRNV